MLWSKLLETGSKRNSEWERILRQMYSQMACRLSAGGVRLKTVGTCIVKFTTWHCIQWRRLHRALGACLPLLQKVGQVGHREYRRTANKKQIKLYWPSPKHLPKRLIVLLEPKNWRGTTKQIFSGALVPPLSNSFRRHWLHCILDLRDGDRNYTVLRIRSLSLLQPVLQPYGWG